MAEIRINTTGGLKLYDADNSHYAQIVAGTITSNVDAITLGHDTVTIADNLSLGSDSAILKFGADTEIALTHVADTGLKLTDSGGTPTLQLHDANESIASDGSKVIITSGGTAFSLPTSDGSNGQVLSTNGSGVLSFATASSADPTSADGDSLGTASAEWSDLYLADGGIIYFGNDQDVTLTHDPDDGLFLKSIATGDDNPVLLTLQTGETDLAANDVIGKIAFQAPDEGTGTDAILVSGAIQAVAEGDHSSSSNATRLEFMTGASEAAATKMWLTSGGKLGLGTAPDLGTLHVRTADSSGGVSGDADELVLENSGHAGVTIASGNSSNGNIYFSDSGNSAIGYIQYGHDNNDLTFAANDTESLIILSDGDIRLPIDEKGLVFGAGSDVYFGSNDGEQGFIMAAGAAFLALGSNYGFQFLTEATAQFQIWAGEGKGSSVKYLADQSDDNDDDWIVGNADTSIDNSTSFNWISFSSGANDMEMALSNSGQLYSEGTMTASTSVDYAEYFEWKTELASDAKITETYGMTVVLDNGKVRLAETGEEAKVLGVVRPNDVSAVIGGEQEFKWKDKFEKNVWGETVMEEYTLVKWNETRTKYWKDGDTLPKGVSVGDKRKDYVHEHKYHKDRIPSKVLKNESELNMSEPDWHTLASNLTSEDLVVPSTNAEKTAASYVEKTVYSKDKGDHKKDDKLMRKKVNSSYDSTKVYVPRLKRRKEWCVVGLIGQVEVRDSAIVPTSWIKMKNLESGIDLYYIK